MSRFRSKFVPFLVTILVCLLGYDTATRADHASVSINTGVASPIATESALTLPQKHWSVGIRSEFIDFDRYSDAELTALREAGPEADLHSVDSLLSVSAGIFYGVTDDLTVGLRVPYIRRDDIREPEHGHDSEEIEQLGDADGLGDTTLFGQYRFYHDTETQTHAAVLFGVKTPTGRTSESSAEGRLDTELQPGSGSWDGLFGLAFTKILGRYAFDANVLYTLVTEGSQDTDLGDIFDYNFALSYRLTGGTPNTFATTQQGAAWDLILELNGEWRDQEEVNGAEDGNSGGNVVYLSPGARFSYGRWSLATSFGYPVVNDFNNDQVEPDYRVLSSLSFSF